MSIYLTQEELSELRLHKQEYDDIISNLGIITVNIEELNNKLASFNQEKINYLNAYNTILERNNKIGSVLMEKYGSGQINIETGEIS